MGDRLSATLPDPPSNYTFLPSIATQTLTAVMNDDFNLYQIATFFTLFQARFGDVYTSFMYLPDDTQAPNTVLILSGGIDFSSESAYVEPNITGTEQDTPTSIVVSVNWLTEYPTPLRQTTQQPVPVLGSVLLEYLAGQWVANCNTYIPPYLFRDSGENYQDHGYFTWPGNDVLRYDGTYLGAVLTYRYSSGATFQLVDYATKNILTNITASPAGINAGSFGPPLPAGPLVVAIRRLGPAASTPTFDLGFQFSNLSALTVMFLVPYQDWDAPLTAGLPYTDFWYPGTSQFNGRQPTIYVTYTCFDPDDLIVTIMRANILGVPLARITGAPATTLVGFTQMERVVPFPAGATKLRVYYPVGVKSVGIYSLTIIN